MAKNSRSGVYPALQVPESMPKNPMKMDPGIKAMQQRLGQAKKMKPMKNPKVPVKQMADFAKNVTVG